LLTGKQQLKSIWTNMSNRNLVKKGLNYISHYGVKGFARKVQEQLRSEPVPYKEWYPHHFVSQDEKEEQYSRTFPYNPVISIIVPTYETPKDFLCALIESVQDQTYGRFELCIADGSKTGAVKSVVNGYMVTDTRIKYKRLEKNEGISGNTNSGIDMATGEYIALLDHDDIIEPNALFEVVRVINEDKEAALIYSDEDKTDYEGREFFKPHLKPDFDLGLLRSNNYICHFLVVKKELVSKVGGLNPEFDGAQDYDFILRCIENTDKIYHIPKVLYHWRVSENSTAENPSSKTYAFEAGRRALEAHLDRVGLSGTVTNASDLGYYRVRLELPEEPSVSVIITTRNKNTSLVKCVDSVRKSDYGNFDFYLVEEDCEAINRCVEEEATGEFILILNEELTIPASGWMREMVSQCAPKDVGAVGCKILTPAGKLFNKNLPVKAVYHGGMIIGLGGIVGNAFKGLQSNLTGYAHRASIIGDCSAVSPLMFMIKRETFLEYDGLDRLPAPGLAGPDLCLRMRENNLRIVYDPYVVATYYGQGAKINPRDREWMRNRWAHLLSRGDRYYNPGFSLESPGFILKAPKK